MTTIAITPGSEEGIGPELMLKALTTYNDSDSLGFIWCGDAASLKLAGARSRLIISFESKTTARLSSKLTIQYMGDYLGTNRSAWFLKNAVSLASQKSVNAIVTGPIEKSALTNLDGESYAGQTEYFSRHLGLTQNTMMTFMGGPCIMSLYSTHLPLHKVADVVNEKSLTEHLLAVTYHAARILNKAPQNVAVTVLGLNPHAGENGLLGHEEQKIIKPVIAKLKEQDFKIAGPVAADGFFAYLYLMKPQDIPDVVVAMYHDQGLIPYKLLAKGAAVNVTLGLSVPRVSPAHGTGCDLVGLSMACSKSTDMAFKVAIRLAQPMKLK
jgi:4-hydroxy-L-threonine phosphate dehydrogenase PdxA